MSSVIEVRKNKDIIFKLDKSVFETLFEHTIARRKTKFADAINSGYITFDDFMNLTRAGEVPYPLFFLDKKSIDQIIRDYEKMVYFGVSKDQMSIASRGEIVLADISLILKDITRKQNFIKKYIVDENSIPGTFKKTKQNVVDHAQAMRSLLGYDIPSIENISKEKTFDILVKGLAARNVFVSVYAHHYTPQTIDADLQFSGIAINDKKCPFLFIKAGDNDSLIEPWGRRLFTASLLLSCLGWGNCGPLTMDGKSADLVDDRHYIFAEEFLMPESYMLKDSTSSFSDINVLASKYSVSASAVVMRAFRLSMINEQTKDEYLEILAEEWSRLTSKKGGGNPLGLVKGINRYNNPAVVEIILEKHRTKVLDAHGARNLLCYKKGDTLDIGELSANV